jgi:hypothetical protein
MRMLLKNLFREEISSLVTVKRFVKTGTRAAALVGLLAPALFGQSYEDLVGGAKQLAQNSQYTEAAEQAKRAIDLNAARWEAYAVAGVAFAKQADCGIAADYLRAAVPRAPEAQKPALLAAINDCRTPSPLAAGALGANNAAGASLAVDEEHDANGKVVVRCEHLHSAWGTGLTLGVKARTADGVFTLGPVISFKEGSGHDWYAYPEEVRVVKIRSDGFDMTVRGKEEHYYNCSPAAISKYLGSR